MGDYTSLKPGEKMTIYLFGLAEIKVRKSVDGIYQRYSDDGWMNMKIPTFQIEELLLKYGKHDL